MYISLNEYEDAEFYLSERDLSGDIANKLRVIARYYLDKKMKKAEVREKLCQHISRIGESPTLNYWSDMIDYAIKRAAKTPLITIGSIPINSQELKKIDELKGVQLQRLAFTLLCLSKYRYAVNPDCNHWICFEDSDIMRMANVKVSLKRRAELYRTLKDMGYLRFPKKGDSISMQVLMAEDECDETVLNITNFKNLGYQYLKYKGEPYFECANCGDTVKRNANTVGRPQKYCDQCAALIHAKQMTDAVMRSRLSIK